MSKTDACLFTQFANFSGKACQASNQKTTRVKNKNRSSFKLKGLEKLSFKRIPLNGVITLNNSQIVRRISTNSGVFFLYSRYRN